MWVLLTILGILGLNDGTVGNSSLQYQKLTMAEQGHAHFRHTDGITSNKVVIIDYSKPSDEKRLYVVNIETDEVLLETYVAHGKNSGNNHVNSISNKVNSNQSSMGFFKISEKYVGKHGESYRLDGLEKGYNHNARRRAIVIHSAWYVSEEIIRNQGRLGRSFGCPALSTEVYAEFQNLIEPNMLLFIYYPDETYLANSAVFSTSAFN